jgi:hypothetical protein
MMKRPERIESLRALYRYLEQPLVASAIGAVFVFIVLRLSGAGALSPFWALYLLPLCLVGYRRGFEAGLALALSVFAAEGVWAYF